PERQALRAAIRVRRLADRLAPRAPVRTDHPDGPLSLTARCGGRRQAPQFLPAGRGISLRAGVQQSGPCDPAACRATTHLKTGKTAMRIASIGTGNVGSALARGFARAGHQLLLGVRDVNNADAAALARETRGQLKSPAEAAAGGEVVVLALPWQAAE